MNQEVPTEARHVVKLLAHSKFDEEISRDEVEHEINTGKLFLVFEKAEFDLLEAITTITPKHKSVDPNPIDMKNTHVILSALHHLIKAHLGSSTTT